MTAELQPNNLQVRVRCPKGMKLPKSIKVMAAMSRGTKESRNQLMRFMGTALHEAALKAKRSAKTSSDSKDTAK